jgi:ABC-2 type transport system ATP-binding protein
MIGVSESLLKQGHGSGANIGSVCDRLWQSSEIGANLPMQLGRMFKRHRPSDANRLPDQHEATDYPSLVVQNLSKQYKGGVWANREITLTGNAGEILGILGPNGAGKTTLVRQITTELMPTSGSIHVMGLDVVREPNKVKSQLGVVPQEATLFDYLSVYQHLRIFAKLRGVKPRESRAVAERLIQELELSAHRDIEVRKLSGGLKRRVLLGIASVGRPSVMVLDEPTTGLDPQSRRNLWSLLRRARESGAFILLTTHSMEEAEALCDRVGIIQDGKMLALDTVANLRANHRFPFKVTYFVNGSTAEPITLFGSDDQELVAKMKEMGIRQFSLGSTTLEDAYLDMTGGLEGFDDSDG